MASDDSYIKGYESTDPADANPSQEHTRKPWLPCGGMAEAVRERWRGVPVPYPRGKRPQDGGGGGGE
jgi:hypothetical protein